MMEFDSFVIFAEMRTGSNFLEANLNALPGVTCHGEVFNPHFPGYPNRDNCLGFDMTARDADPGALLAALREAPGLNGFRFFHDHDPRVAGAVLADPRCAKIVLGRNPVDSYVSLKIARATDQWKLTDVRRRRGGAVVFDPAEFREGLAERRAFRDRLRHALQVSGQTAFYLDYEELQNLEVLNGLAAFLGLDARLDAPDTSLKVQNPGAVEEKVLNADEMHRALADPELLDIFGLDRAPDLEPRRGPRVPQFLAAARSGLIFLPVPGGPGARITAWLSAVDGAPPLDGFSRRSLRDWQKGHPGHISFSVLRHPAYRIKWCFDHKIMYPGAGSLPEIRRVLINRFGLDLPASTEEDYGPARYDAALAGFVDFVGASRAGQTGLRVDAHWASQAVLIEGMSRVLPPRLLLREDELEEALPRLAPGVSIGTTESTGPVSAALQDRIEHICARDYETFGFARLPER